MKYFLIITFVLLAHYPMAQIGEEDYYSENILKSNLERAKTPLTELDAMGSLAVFYKKIHKDSLGNFHIRNLLQKAERSGKIDLIARSLFWNDYFIGKTESASKYLQYAEQHNLVKDKIAAHFSLIDYYLHENLSLAENFCIKVEKITDAWKIDTIGKDSLRLEMYGRLAHAYIHKKDGLKVSKYLSLLQHHIINGETESIKMLANTLLAHMYFEWLGQEKKAILFLEKDIENYTRVKQPYKILRAYISLAIIYTRLDQLNEARHYFNEISRLQKELGSYGYFQYYMLLNKFGIGILTLEEALSTLDNNFNNTLSLPKAKIATTKAEFYMRRASYDTMAYYLTEAKRLGEDNLQYWATYFWRKKDYKNLVPVLKKIIKAAETEGDLNNLRWRYKRLGEVYSIQGDYKSAYLFTKKSMEMMDSLDKLTNVQAVADLEMQKEIDLQKADFDAQTRIREAEQAKRKYKNTVGYAALIASAGIMLLITGILWRNNQRKQKDKLRIENAYAELKSTQTQLIQSEKMASLGELTAGIAHEIQNPLNFVNNFSEINSELIEELQTEISKDNTKAVELLGDLRENESKILHHGKRADAIVKGMLQHSRSSTGQKELTDINLLADEYLRLAYHGLRAKDKSFNAKFETDFDPTLQKINVIPQDLGRAILNLINNAFYAVSAKAASTSDEAYIPMVALSTRRSGDKVQIRIKDNGTGIAEKLTEKIFQPFFTTKPTGQGTGLGLSLSYDIITKAHGGELKVNTREQVGSEFIIELPIR